MRGPVRWTTTRAPNRNGSYPAIHPRRSTAAGGDDHAAIDAIGLWAGLAGILQLATGIRRWRTASAQWPQILSGAQSGLAAVHFLMKATSPASIVTVADVAPYAAFGALYFAISAGVLAVKR